MRGPNSVAERRSRQGVAGDSRALARHSARSPLAPCGSQPAESVETAAAMAGVECCALRFASLGNEGGIGVSVRAGVGEGRTDSAFAGDTSLGGGWCEFRWGPRHPCCDERHRRGEERGSDRHRLSRAARSGCAAARRLVRASALASTSESSGASRLTCLRDYAALEAAAPAAGAPPTPALPTPPAPVPLAPPAPAPLALPVAAPAAGGR